MPPEAPVCEPDEQTVWSPLLPVMEEGTEDLTPLSADEIVRLAAETLQQATDKPIVIADEPAAHLTFELTQRMLELLRQQAEAGKTVLIASRKAEVIVNADQIIDLDRL